MSTAIIVPLRALIVVIALLCLFGQVILVPAAAAVAADEAPDAVRFAVRAAFIVAGVLFIVCAEVVLAAIWVLLTKVHSDRIFDPTSIRAVDVVIAALAAGSALVAIVIAIAIAAGAAPPAIGILLVAGLVGGVTLVLLVVVMRGLLRRATTLRLELAEVV